MYWRRVGEVMSEGRETHMRLLLATRVRLVCLLLSSCASDEQSLCVRRAEGATRHPTSPLLTVGTCTGLLAAWWRCSSSSALLLTLGRVLLLLLLLLRCGAVVGDGRLASLRRREFAGQLCLRQSFACSIARRHS